MKLAEIGFADGVARQLQAVFSFQTSIVL